MKKTDIVQSILALNPSLAETLATDATHKELTGILRGLKAVAREAETSEEGAPPKAAKGPKPPPVGAAQRAKDLAGRMGSWATRLEGLGDLSNRPRAEHGAIAQSDGAPARDAGEGNLLVNPHNSGEDNRAADGPKRAMLALVGQEVYRVCFARIVFIINLSITIPIDVNIYPGLFFD